MLNIYQKYLKNMYFLKKKLKLKSTVDSINKWLLLTDLLINIKTNCLNKFVTNLRLKYVGFDDKKQKPFD